MLNKIQSLITVYSITICICLHIRYVHTSKLFVHTHIHSCLIQTNGIHSFSPRGKTDSEMRLKHSGLGQRKETLVRIYVRSTIVSFMRHKKTSARQFYMMQAVHKPTMKDDLLFLSSPFSLLMFFTLWTIKN